MKIGTEITLDKMPGCNGRPQLWWSICNIQNNRFGHDRMRILYPDGRVEYFWEGQLEPKTWSNGCTSSTTQEFAQRSCLRWSIEMKETTYFLGYL